MVNSELKILVVDDEPSVVKEYCAMISNLGYANYPADMANNAFEICKQNNIDVAIIDSVMPVIDGISTGKTLREISDDIVLIMLTGHGPNFVTEALAAGFDDYLIKPASEDQLKVALIKAGRLREIRLEKAELRREVERSHTTKKKLLGNSEPMREVIALADDAAPTDCNVVITGNTGTGKELLARYIHYNSRRKKGPFVPINCGALTENLLEDELFGHEKGSFTGAIKLKRGHFELAQNGTIFLDEVTTCLPALQVKLLRVLQEQEYKRVGGEYTLNCDVRVIAATNDDLQAFVNKGLFREDLFFRLNVFPIHMPELVARRDDILILSNYFLTLYADKYGKHIEAINKEAENYLLSASWPGNVRELENCIERAVVLCKGTLVKPIHFGIKSAKLAKDNSNVTPRISLNPDVEERLDCILLLRHLINKYNIKHFTDDALKKQLTNFTPSCLELCESVTKYLEHSDSFLNAVLRCKTLGRVINPAIDILMGQKSEGALKAWWKKNADEVKGVVTIHRQKYSLIIPDLKRMSREHFMDAFQDIK